MTNISNLAIPLLVLFIIVYAILKKVDIYDIFIDGASESFSMVLTLFPCYLGMIFGINLFVKSGILEYIFKLIKPLFEYINVPIQIFPMMIMRPISGSSSLALLTNILSDFGPDSFIGRLASVIQGSTDTTFYVLSLYFGSIGIKKIRYALWAGLAADLIGITSAILIVKFMFG